MKLHYTLITALIISSFLTACDDKKPINTANQNIAAGIKDASASTSGLPTYTGVGGHNLANNVQGMNSGTDVDDPNAPKTKVIYFMLDSSEIQPDYVPIVKAHAQYLVANPSLKIVLEGNTDERGSREYNIALGEQRARSVSNLLTAQGVASNQLQVVSYGEEKPAAIGGDESAWEQNRRVEIVYQR
jgi:peptidoglycan-associated lipoprotein